VPRQSNRGNAKSPIGTRERIIRASESLFAQHGIEGVSYRQIASKAKVNLASINYHFGNKQTLLAEIFSIHSKPIVERRYELLAACAKQNDCGDLLERVIEAFLLPAFEAAKRPGGLNFLHLRARISNESDEMITSLFYDNFDQTTRIFMYKLRSLLPHLGDKEFYWRFHFFLGSYIYVLAGSRRIEDLSGGVCQPNDFAEALRNLTAHAAQSFRAPSSGYDS
jgi:AcrR family transcriptional regulator